VSPAPAPPTKVVMGVLIITGAAAAGASGKTHYGKTGMWIGIFLGALAGWLAGWWVKRNFLDF
jgi:outer membrane lipoprotein SlyB